MAHDISPARVRFAPSPTGFLHLGGLRTALFDYLLARHTGGQFILRIEDTDQSRYKPESLQFIMSGLRWLGLEWDEGPDKGGPYAPYTQSERKALGIYQKYAEQLIASGHAYKAFTPVEVWETDDPEAEEEQVGQRKPYDRRDRGLTPEQVAAYEAEGRSYAIRFKAPLEGETIVPDLIRGNISFQNKLLTDLVLLKSDGMPTYHLAMVVDDQLMKITHILRGEEWLPSAPIHKMLFDAFGWQMPVLVHLPVILSPSGKGKMSKRKQVVDGKEYLALVHEFEEAGYVNDALFNFLTNIGWSFDAEREIFTRAEAIERFDITRVTPKPAALPYSKLEWMNGEYIRMMDNEELHRRLAPVLSKQLGIPADELLRSEQLHELIPLIKERIKFLTDAAQFVDWAFVGADQIRYPDPKIMVDKKLTPEQVVANLKAGIAVIEALPEFTIPALESSFRAKCEELGMKIGPFLVPFRVSLTGKTVAPPLFESMMVLGKFETLTRLQNGLKAVEQ